MLFVNLACLECVLFAKMSVCFESTFACALMRVLTYFII
ncbi:Hypothetical protein BN2458_PEG0310 [Helicobacter typhlonius]|uniref:Uncharacterized protein n=1 Tax=Helicobacter typhlonius TaxID=76936 RepID=A0A0S4PSH4_9HELI|nr:Hypothetical protein BN2458_PEG0310 [Helicobacter typhlonius]